MSIRRMSCCLCGCAIIHESWQPPWMAHFSAVYALGHEADTPAYLSGPGFRGRFEDFVKPHSPPGLSDGEELLQITLLRPGFGEGEYPSESPQAWGFPFHSVCWKMLSLSCPAEALDIQTLFRLCRSFPSQQGLMNWGHDYGGRIQYETVLAPGEEPGRHDSFFGQTRAPDPFDIPELHSAFEQPASYPEPDTFRPFAQAGSATGSGIFEKLPTEILLRILAYLPSPDVVRLKQASRIYASVALPDSFWKSRFLPGREFQHIFEAEQYLLSRRGRWRSIFSMVKTLQAHPAMLHRRRIWHLCLLLHRVLEATRDTSCDGNPIRTFFEPNGPLDDGRWVSASRALKLPSQDLSEGSRALYNRTLVLPPKPAAIFASTINLFGRCYISGIRILDTGGKSFSIGYRHPDKEAILSGDGQLRIEGFCLALDQRGVRGLAVISDDGTSSNWLGDHHGIPKRKLVLTSAGISVVDCLKGGFDVSDSDRLPLSETVSWPPRTDSKGQTVKLVSLSIASTPETQKEPEAPLSALDSLLWYPDIPPLGVSALGASDGLQRPDPRQDLPLCFSLFGPDGERAHNLMGILVRMDDARKILSISTPLGDMRGAKRLGLWGNELTDEDDFEIDGPEGERITGLDTFHGYGQFLGFKVS
ncbi:hypothetical protein ACJZ2D_002803 [Fusarium nematophilum]